jgi:hypothetical protein
VPTDVVVDTSIDTPAPIDTPTPMYQKFQTEQSFRRKHLQSKTFKLCKKQGKEFATFDEALRKKEPIVQEKIVDPWENVIDDEDRQYLQFKKETGRVVRISIV